MAGTVQHRRLPIGAELVKTDGAHFRVWAPRRKTAQIVLEKGPEESSSPSHAIDLAREEGGYFSGLVPGVAAGALYRYRLDDEVYLYPDPASRFQPQGPHGPSQVVDSSSFDWSAHDWKGCVLPRAVIYEMHIGTFTPQGTWEAASAELPELATLGITVVEVMPVADFPGRFGWGYDGVDLFAPTRLYGKPDDFRQFVDHAHAVGIGVILDVVYNHFGPDGNYLKAFSEEYFTDRYSNEWGEAINFDGEHSSSVREFFVTNARYWIEEFHLDGLRLDATQTIYDSSSVNILTEIGQAVRQAANGRFTLVVAENEAQQAKLALPVDEGGFGLDALWNDDYHHSAAVAMTGRAEAYRMDYRGTPQELVSAAKYGFLYQGQHYLWQNKPRGTPIRGLSPATFVVYIQNHDQIANSGRGLRCHQLTSPGVFRAMTALTLLLPETPMLFQGQEFCSSSPFLFFADHNPELSKLVDTGRRKFLAQFSSLATPTVQSRLARPDDPSTFERCKLDLSERVGHAEAYSLHRDLLRLRREDPVFNRQEKNCLDGAVLGPSGFVLRFFTSDQQDRLLLLNLGPDLRLSPAPEPLLAPPEHSEWTLLWSSEDRQYGADGTRAIDSHAGWTLPGQSAVVMIARPTE